MGFSERKKSLVALGSLLTDKLLSIENESSPGNSEIETLLSQVVARNAWFTKSSVTHALQVWENALSEKNIEEWSGRYDLRDTPRSVRTVGVVNAGNIPFVGLHDLLCVYLSGNRYIGKNASDDPFLLPWLVTEWKKVCPELNSCIDFTDRLSGIDAVIATGSDNSARYFEYYFGKYPHIIRRNRNGLAILDGKETAEELSGLGSDIFTYYGMGCRNVAKIYVPADYELSDFFEAMYPFHRVMEHHKYMNNFDHHHAVYLLKGIPFLQNNFVILREEAAIASPLAVVYYERYDTQDELIGRLVKIRGVVQCIAASCRSHNTLIDAGLPFVSFGETQSPSLWDYADGVDTLEFLVALG